MANKDDYLTYYREFFENFAQTVNPNDQLPVKLASYKLINLEVIGGVIDWTTQYLTQKKCPQSLIAPLIQIVIDETRKSCKKQPIACGFNPSDNAYEPLKLMQTVMAKTNEICLRYLDNSMLCSLPSPGLPHNVVSMYAAKNKRRRMEDRHVVIHDLNTMFNIQEASPSSYYAIFDGHAGHDAAAYSSAHLHQFLAESKHFVANPEQALRDAFCKTDALFIDKCNVERFTSGTTAVCALLRSKEKTLYIAWVGDSQALLVNQGRVLQCVNPHKPCRGDERERIEKQGGYVCYWGTWRVNGQLAVSRAIGDAEYKPYVIAVPDIREIPLDGGEDFLILACDGLWDFLSEDDAAKAVYNMVCQYPDKTDLISEHLVYLSKERGSTDNISVIVVFLREPSKIAAEAHWANRNASPITMDTSLDNANNPFTNSNGADNNIIAQKTDGLLLNLSENFKHNGADLSPAGDFYHNTEKSNGKRLASEFDDDDDLGPETDVDAIDDVLSPSIVAAKALADGIVNNNPDGSFNPFVEKHEVEKAALEIDLDLQKQQSSEFDGQRSPREETPTPPADAVHDGGLEENIGDSGEESEDEWNYIKGEEANKENISPSQPDCEVANILEEQDNMSQLNPNAAEFVPVSPTRSIPSPACRALLNDSVIAQSPKRPSDIDINLPNPQEFEKEVKSRPSDFDSYSNGHDLEGDHKPSSQELMENLLNGKNIDEIPEFQPGTTPTKVPSNEEFHFGPNAAPFTPAKLLDQSEAALSTKAVYGDESTITFDSTFDSSMVSRDNVDFTIKNKEDDPMSMSFYQDKSGGEVDPFDLNKVQMLPENIDDFLGKSDDHNILHDDTISDLPEHDPAKNLISDEVLLNNDERIQTTDLDKVVDDEKELASPVSNDEELISGVCELSRSPNPQTEDLVDDLECDLPKDILPDVCIRPESKSPQPEISEDVCGLPQTKSLELVEEVALKAESSDLQVASPEPKTESPEPQTVSPAPPGLSPEPQAISPAPATASPVPQALSPEPPQTLSPEPQAISPAPQALSPEPQALSLEPRALSPEPAVLSPEPQVLSPEPQALSPEPQVLSPEPQALSPEPQALSPEPQALSPEPQALSPEPQALTPEPQALSPEPQALSPEPQALSPEPQALSPEPQASSPESQALSLKPQAVSPEPQPSSPEPQAQSPVLHALSPEPHILTFEPQTQSLELLSTTLEPKAPSPEPQAQVLSPEPSDDLCMTSKSPVLQAVSLEPSENVCNLPKSPEPEKIMTPEPEQLIDTTSELIDNTSHLINEQVEDVCKFVIDERKDTSVESPIEDVTSSVKDVSSPVISPVPDQIANDTNIQLNYAQEINNAVQATVPVESSSPIKEEHLIPEVCPLSTPKSITDTESVLTADVNSFLERSQISDLASPLSPGEQPLYLDGTLNVNHPLNKCVYPLPLSTTEIKTETITPEFAEPAVITPTEQTKEDTSSVPSVIEESVKEPEVENKTITPEEIATVATAAGLAATAVTAAVVAEKKTATKPKTPTAAARKPATKSAAASPTKAASSPTKAKAAPAAKARLPPTSKPSTTTTKPITGAVPKQPLSKLAAKPKTAPSTAKPSSVEKKPLANGDVKAPIKSNLTARRSLESSKTPTSKPTTTTSKPSPTKLTASRPPTAPAKTAAKTAPAAAPKPRPSTLVKTSTSTNSKTVSSTTTAKVTLSKTTTSPKTTSPPKARPATAPSKPRVPLTKTVSKTSTDTEKQNKDSANKLTASRTATSTRTATGTASARTLASSVRKTDVKTTGTTRTTVTKTTTTTTRPSNAGKKPLEITRNVSKTKTTKIEKPVQNGVTTVVTEQITIVNNAVNESDPQLMKDNSPIDNKLIVETNAAD